MNIALKLLTITVLLSLFTFADAFFIKKTIIKAQPWKGSEDKGDGITDS